MNYQHTPASVLQSAVETLVPLVGELSLLHAVDGPEPILSVLNAILMAADVAHREIVELRDEEAFEVIAALGEQGEARDRSK